jgi:hypothetical protein
MFSLKKAEKSFQKLLPLTCPNESLAQNQSTTLLNAQNVEQNLYEWKERPIIIVPMRKGALLKSKEELSISFSEKR